MSNVAAAAVAELSNEMNAAVLRRASDACELCGAPSTTVLGVGPDATTADRCVAACDVYIREVREQTYDDKHWFCLRESMWSEVAAVQVLSIRLLRRLREHSWAQDLLDQVYVNDDVSAWIDAEGDGATHGDAPTLDAHGTQLLDGDAVSLIKDLDVKGGGFVAKRGTMVRNIKTIGDPEHIEGRVNNTVLVLKTKFLKKAN